MARLLLILALVGTAFWVYSIVDCAIQPSTRHRGVGKPAWLAIVILVPVLGGVLWFVVGRGRPSPAAPLRRAPDDDPEFLGRVRISSDQDERIRRLEEELAQLDAESDEARFRAERDGDGTAPPSQPKPDDGDDARGQRGAVG
ncbi:PLDc N-terminal domain-containing protein [Microbacterium sp. NPDC091313]